MFVRHEGRIHFLRNPSCFHHLPGDRVFDSLSWNETNCPVVAGHEGQTLFPVGHATWKMINAGNTANCNYSLPKLRSIMGYGYPKVLRYNIVIHNLMWTVSGSWMNIVGYGSKVALDQTNNRVLSRVTNELPIVFNDIAVLIPKTHIKLLSCGYYSQYII